MPTFEYYCDDCEVEFEELLIQKAEVQEYFDHHPCPQCKKRAERIRVASFSFKFAGQVNQGAGSGVHGNSGVHDLDYPVLDKAVGRSAEAKWEGYDKRKEERDKVRREAGTNAISQDGDRIAAADAGTIETREKALNLFNKGDKSVLKAPPLKSPPKPSE